MSQSDFRVLDALLHKGLMPVNARRQRGARDARKLPRGAKCFARPTVPSDEDPIVEQELFELPVLPTGSPIPRRSLALRSSRSERRGRRPLQQAKLARPAVG